MSKAKIKVGIVGGAGYTAGELIRILLNHPELELAFVHSESQAGRAVASAHADLWSHPELKFSGVLQKNADVLFLCVGHGQAKAFLEKNGEVIGRNTKIIDLSQDFRLHEHSQGFVYGLPELQKAQLAEASRIANPGCFATCINLCLLPLAQAGQIVAPVHITGITGSTGAGHQCTETTHFSWRFGNVAVYKAFQHQHLAEIQETLASPKKQHIPTLHWVPLRGGFTRGILVSLYFESDMGKAELTELYQDFYKDQPFTHVIPDEVDLKMVLNTNHCFLNVSVIDDRVHVVGVLDNLLKGASGQAVQNMNLALQIAETAGLNLKASAF